MLAGYADTDADLCIRINTLCCTCFLNCIVYVQCVEKRYLKGILKKKLTFMPLK